MIKVQLLRLLISDLRIEICVSIRTRHKMHKLIIATSPLARYSTHAIAETHPARKTVTEQKDVHE